MRELQLNEIAAYLPYELEVESTDGWASPMVSIVSGMVGLLTDDTDNIEYFDLKEVKPILRTLNGLTHEQLKEIVKHLFKDSQMIRPCYNPDYNQIRCEKGFISFYDDNTMQRYTVVKPGGNGLPVLNMSNNFSDYEVFFKLHVDLFGLIESGLAIDSNTISHA